VEVEIKGDLMRICYIANAESIHTQRWVQYFAGKGHEVHLISSTSPVGNCPQNVRLYLIKVLQGIRGVNHPFSTIQIRRIMNRINPDILHAHYVADYGFWAALCWFHPFVVTAWGSDILVRPQESKLSKWMVKFTLKQADLITCDAEHLTYRMTDLGARKEKIKIIYFGVDIHKFNSKQRDVGLKEKLELKSSSPTIISLRNLSPIYDVESLIKAIPLVLSNVPDAKFIIAGDGEQRNYLENLAVSLGVPDSIKFTGRIPNDELPRYVASSDIYVSTSLSDAGLAASTAEAMACELPVVITDFGNNRDWVKDGEGGFIIPTKNPFILAEKIGFLLKNEDVRRRFGKINRGVIEERNNYEKEMKLMEDIYFQLINNNPSKR
jgi:glycosyltransferase involved in cell wall biosynthesis